MRLQLLLLCLLGTAAVAAETPRDFGQAAGYRRDGSGVYPGVKPPTSFKFPDDLRWKAQVPCWGLGSPIVVAGRVFLCAEPAPERYWPELLCYALADGKLLWRQELDSAEALFPGDEAKRQDATDRWKNHVDITRQGIVLRYRYQNAEDESEKEKLLAQGVELGFRADRRFGGLHLMTRKNPAQEFGFGFGGWYPNYPTVIGIAYPTPVSDGTHVYVRTWHGLVACFDLEGNRQWLAHQPVDLPKVRNCGCSGGRSPIIYRNLLISDLGDMVYAFDRSSGKVLWSDQVACSTIVSPVILTVPAEGGATADVLWAAGGQAYLLPDGKRLKVAGWDAAQMHGTMSLVKYDEPDVLFISGRGEHCGWKNKGKCDTPPPAALRLQLAGEELQVTVLWNGVEGKGYGSNCPHMCYHEGRLYFPGRRGCILDALTGKVLQGDLRKKRSSFVAETHHLLTVADGHIYGFKGVGKAKGSDPALTPGAVMQVSTPAGKIIATSTIPELPINEADRVILDNTTSQRRVGNRRWGTFAHSGSDTYTFGPDCIIIRGNARLYCIGK